MDRRVNPAAPFTREEKNFVTKCTPRINVPQIVFNGEKVITTGGVRILYTKKFPKGIVRFKSLNPMDIASLPEIVELTMYYHDFSATYLGTPQVMVRESKEKDITTWAWHIALKVTKSVDTE